MSVFFSANQLQKRALKWSLTIYLDSQIEKGNILKAEKLSLERVLEERKERITKLEADYEKLQQELIGIVKNVNTSKE